MAGTKPVPKTHRVLRALERAGFRREPQAGSHFKLRRAGRIAIVPDHGGKDMPTGTLRSILNQAGPTAADSRNPLGAGSGARVEASQRGNRAVLVRRGRGEASVDAAKIA
ncbi:MAG: hypothetical protein AVDCRST_MAG73-3105 [uncultured Thermomicrobiales bacterium]|uniref:Type II toxin-antitoxin system HicA family toxin n=1 Tax=uncultured Thermomicrobiales bacterium TaxID=1645740 RepID=A0A6J4UJX4_9BACT|nr:MAG: hypothetical protein AVDCRST_MAG73-3105 [uncultured Thermomicrobiales bacterium]